MAAVTKRAQGPPTRHILASEGPSSYPLHFYSTTYSVQHSRNPTYPSSSFRHKGTGYVANFRPSVFYNRDIDKTQTPSIAKLLEGVYYSLTSRDYMSPDYKTGSEQLPSMIREGPSGFTHNLPITRPPFHHQTSNETAYRIGYPQKQFRSDSIIPSSHTNKEGSGFTNAYNVEPITYRPTECHIGELPDGVTWRPTGRSIMKQDFTHVSPLTGHEPVPLLSVRACQSNGFIKGNCCPAEAQPIDTKGPTLDRLHPHVARVMSRKDPAMYSTVTHPHQYTAYTPITYRPQHIHPYVESGNSIGRKEPSGYSENRAPLLPSMDSFQHPTLFQDSYQRDGVTQDHPPGDTTRTVLPNGFTKSTCVHYYGPSCDNQETLRKQRPYVARSILAHDPCFVDYTYQHKQRQV